MTIDVRPVGPDELPTCIAIRHEVFVVGQRVPLEVEVDGLDPVALHVLAGRDGRPIGTARLRLVDGAAKVERVAVLESERGGGVGARIMAELHRLAVENGRSTVLLNAQVAVLGFYERLGYVAYGPVFLDAGIDHRAMRLELSG